MQDYLVPEQHYMLPADLREASGDQGDHVREVPTMRQSSRDTYFFPVLRLCSFKSTCFRYAKTSSTGDASHPYGAAITTFIAKACIFVRVSRAL